LSLRQYLITFGAFAILAFGVLSLLHSDLRPLPVYDSQKSVPGAEIPEFNRGETLVMDFAAPQAGINCVDLRDALFQSGQEVRVDLYPVRLKPEQPGGEVLRFDTLKGESRSDFAPGNTAGEPMRLELQWLRDPGPAPISMIRFRAGNTPVNVPVPGGVLVFQPGERDATAEFEFPAPEANLSAIDLTGMVTASTTRLRMVVTNLETDDDLFRQGIAMDDQVREFRRIKNAKGDRIQVTFKWKTIRPPKLRVAEGVPTIPLEVTANGQPVALRPFVMLGYTWPTWNLHLLWIPALILAGLAFRFPKLMPAGFIGLGLSAAATSVLTWQQLYGTHSAHFDPDEFAKVGGLMANYVRGQDHGEAWAFMRIWRYLWLPFVPMCLAVLNLLGLKISFGYLLVTSLPCFGAMLFFHAILRQSFKLEARWAFLGVLLFICHHFMLRSFSKPSTDAMGLLFMMGTFYLILRRLEHREVWSDFAIGGLLLLLLFTRPTGTLFAPFACGMAVLADWRRQGRIDLPGMFPVALRMALVPAALFVTTFLLLGWGDSLRQASESYTRSFATPRLFFIKMSSCLQWLPLLWIAVWPRMRKDPMIWFLGLWMLYYFFILVLVRPAYVTRIFLPIHFVALIPAVLGLRELWNKGGSWRGSVVGLAAVFVATNLGIVIYQSGGLFPPPPSIVEWL